MRIAQVLLSPRIGGAESLVDSLVSSWNGDGHVSEIFYLDPGEHRSSFRLTSLTRALRRFRPDAVISHSALPNVYARLAAPRGVPVLTVLHSAGDDFEIRKLRWAERVLRRRTAAVIAVSELQLSAYTNRFGTRVRAEVIPNGIRDGLPTKELYASSPSRVTTIARVALQKNPQFWLDVAGKAAATSGELKFTWLGPVTPDPGVAAIVASATSENAVFLPPTSDPGRELLKSDIIFHPASHEAFSIGLLEAAAVGIPVICSDTVSQTLPRGLPVTAYKNLDSQSAAEAILDVRNNYGHHSRAARSYSVQVRERFSVQKCAGKYLELISEVVTDEDP